MPRLTGGPSQLAGRQAAVPPPGAPHGWISHAVPTTRGSTCGTPSAPTPPCNRWPLRWSGICPAKSSTGSMSTAANRRHAMAY